VLAFDRELTELRGGFLAPALRAQLGLHSSSENQVVKPALTPICGAMQALQTTTEAACDE